jgi:hypothetical protein
MHPLLEKWLHKLGISTVDELNDAEKAKFDEWRAVFTTDSVSVEQIEIFCHGQISTIEQKWADLSLSGEQKGVLIPYHTAYKAILRLISSPKLDRERLEKHLTQLLNLPNVVK